MTGHSDRARVYLPLAGAALLVVAVNLMGGMDSFWAKWPLLVFGTLAGLAWARSSRAVDPRFAGLAVVGAAVVAVNLMTWGGEFWAKWPLLGIAIVAGLRFMRESRRGP